MGGGGNERRCIRIKGEWEVEDHGGNGIERVGDIRDEIRARVTR